MRETHFINQNKQKWDEFEHMLQRQDSDPDKMSELFVQVTDDLSYSRTFYPNRSVRVYLNNVAQSIFLGLYKNKQGKRGRLLDFWTDELPRILYDSRRALQLAFLVFALFMGVGMLSSIYDPEFPEFILGSGYIEMTDQNIANGDPMGVYKDEAEDLMFLQITFNNIRVSFITFIFGVFASIGTLFIIIKNAIMVGAFQQYFINKGLFMESFFTIWVHGTLEISAIIIAGGAGLVFGSGLIIPGTYSRGQAFIQSARKGLKIIIGIIPLFVIAGFNESFLTRYTEAPLVLRGGIMLASLLFVLFYYVYYPWHKARSGAFKARYARDEMQATRTLDIDWGRMRSVGDVISETFAGILPFLPRLMLLGLLAGIAYAAMALLVYDNKMGFIFNYQGEIFAVVNFGYVLVQIFNLISDIFQVYNFETKPLFAPLNVAFWWLLLTAGLAMGRRVRANQHHTDGLWAVMWQVAKKHALGTLVYASLIVALLSFEAIIFFALLLPLVMLVVGFAITMDTENLHPIVAVKRTLQLLKGHWMGLIGLYAIIVMLMLLFVSLFCSILFNFYLESVQLVFDFSTQTMGLVTGVFTCILGGIILSIFFGVMVLAMKLFLQTGKEVNEATDLLQRIAQVGTKKRVYGFEQEI